jgi:tRNA-dihydrouridine synthase
MDKINNAISELQELKRISIIKMKKEFETNKTKSEKEIRKSYYGYLKTCPQTRAVERFINEINDINQKNENLLRLNNILIDGIIG